MDPEGFGHWGMSYLYLSDIRNKCDHSTQNEPTEIEVNDLITHTGRHLSLLS